MRSTRKVLGSKAIAVPAGFQRALFFLLFFVPVFLMFLSQAHAAGNGQDLRNYAEYVGDSTYIIVDIFAYAAFIIGIVLSALGVHELRKHVENPQNPLKTALAKFAFGGIFLGFPFIVDVVIDTFGGYDFDPFKLVLGGAYKFGGEGARAGSAIEQGKLGAMIADSSDNSTILVNVACFAAFIIGVWFTLRGLQMLKAHIENPQSGPVADALKRLGVAGALLSLPMIVGVVHDTFGAFGQKFGNSNWTSNSGTTGGLDGMLMNLISDIANPAYMAIEAFCYIAGVMLILFALQRMVTTAQQGARGPLGFGTITTFIVAGLLLSFPQLLATLDLSIFGTSNAMTKVEFVSLAKAADPTQIQNAKNVFSAILAFMAIIGFLSVVRGLFILKAFADGTGQASMMAVVTHIVAGAIAINLGGFINAVQKSLGLTGANIPVTFS
ncbi:MAG: hypothetical protein KGQ41_01955 [Alphaproteobacteria bacterium]|nr:hypothetical protein [Alphaproteobacteria bacterium]